MKRARKVVKPPMFAIGDVVRNAVFVGKQRVVSVRRGRGRYVYTVGPLTGDGGTETWDERELRAAKDDSK